MRILVVTTWYPSAADPVKAVFVRRHVESIALRHEVRVLHVAAPGTAGLSATASPVPVTIVPTRLNDPRSLARSVRLLRRYARAWSPDVMHTMGFSSLAFGAATACRPWVHTEHWSGVVEPASVSRNWERLASARHLLRLPAAVTTVSDYLRGYVEPFARVGAVHVVPNVVTGPRTPPARSGPGIRLLAVGSLTAIKDPLMAVRAVHRLQVRGEHVLLRWAGDGPLSQAVRAEALSLGVTDRVQLLGQVHPDDLDEHFAWSSAFILPSLRETFCVSAAEALLHGRPVVVGAEGGQREFVTSAMGDLVSEATPEGYADAVLDVQRRLGSVNAEVLARPIRERFSPGRVGQEFDRVYLRVS